MAMKPEEVFRFVNLRPVQRIDPDRRRLRYARYGEGRSPLHAAIASLGGEPLRDKAHELARLRLEKADPALGELKRLHQIVETAAAAPGMEASVQVVRDGFGVKPSEFLASDAGRALRDAVWDRVYAHSLAPELKPDERETIFAAARDLHFLAVLDGRGGAARLLRPKELGEVRALIPRDVIPSPKPKGHDKERQHRRMVLEGLDEVHARVERLNQAIDDLRNNDRRLRGKEQRMIVSFPIAKEGEVAGAVRVELGGAVARGSDRSIASPGGATSAATAKAARGATARRRTASVLREQSHIVPKLQPWVFSAEGREGLSAATRDLLDDDRRSFEELEVAEIVAALEGRKYELLSGYLNGLSPTLLPFVVKEAKFQSILGQIALPWYGVSNKPTLPLGPPRPSASTPGTPAGRGIQPLGLGDLLVVRQELLRYVTGEVAHIENVMKSEFRTRSHVRSRETEEIVITETEQIEESEKDLQTTERFELQKESQKTIEDQMSLQAGVAVTASYGPVSVSAHADFALSNSTTEANKSASSFAKEITEKSVSKIMQRAREVRTRRTLERFEEKNEHGFDNKTGVGHVIGIYRWVDKYYKARLINYGRRLMLEFIVPEPAAFFRFVEENKPLEGLTLEKPPEPMVSGRRLRPDDLSRSNYGAFVARYRVGGVVAPPAATTRVSAAFADAAPEAKNVDYAKTSEKLVVPRGYKCYQLYGNFNCQGYQGHFCNVLIGGEAWGSATAGDIEGIIPISVAGYMSAFHVNVVAQCVLTNEAWREWQQKTYDAIMQAYEKALADYYEQISAAQIQAGVRIEGRNPEINRKLERDELRRGVLGLLTDDFAQTGVNGGWRFDEAFDATQDAGRYGYPELDNAEALIEGKIIQFFEQAFEWTNMTYRFYPYIWGRKQGWRDVLPINDPDPQFTEFLRAGAARVVVPAHPAYAEAVLHYLSTSEIWNGGNPPTLDDPLYISIVDELKADASGALDDTLAACAADSGYPCLADEWEVKLPTTLVYLQPDDQLPDFAPFSEGLP